MKTELPLVSPEEKAERGFSVDACVELQRAADQKVVDARDAEVENIKEELNRCDLAATKWLKEIAKLKGVLLTPEDIRFLAVRAVVDMIENEWDIDGVTMPPVWQIILAKLKQQAEYKLVGE